MHGAIPLRHLNGITAGAVVEGWQDDNIHLLLKFLDGPNDQNGVHPDTAVLGMVLEHTYRQDNGPILVNSMPDLIGKHEFVAHYTSTTFMYRSDNFSTPVLVMATPFSHRSPKSFSAKKEST